MARPWLVSVVVMLLTLAPMHTAWAECAWVLWLEQTEWTQMPNQAPRGTPLWEPEESFLKPSECNDARPIRLRRWADGMESRGRYTVRSGTDGKLYADRIKDDEHSQEPQNEMLRSLRRGVIAQARCLPDTVDPRGPKGGGR